MSDANPVELGLAETAAAAASAASGNSPTTVDLLKRLRLPRADAAWAAFDARYRPLLLAVVRRVGLNENAADDAVQQALLEFFRDWARGAYDADRGRLRTWLLAIARHRAIDVLRRTDQQRGWQGDTAIGYEPDVQELEQTWDEAQRKSILAEAIGRLRATSRTEPRTLDAFERFALQGVPAERVAVDLAFDVAEVYRIKSRLILKLRELIAQIEREWEA